MDKKLHNRIVVTGATGMLGSHCINFLIGEGYENILALKRSSSDLSLTENFKEKVEWVEADITDITTLDFLSDNDIIIHTAALVSYESGAKQKMYEVNIKGTENLVNEALHAEIEKFIHISSVAAIGSQLNGEFTDENQTFDQNAENSPYSISKHFSERQVWRGQQEGLNTVILNPTVILGGGFWKKGSSAIFHRTNQGLPFYPKGSTGFVDVRDVVKACRNCIEKDISNERIILNGANINYKEFFEILTEKLDANMPKRALPDWLGGIFWRWEWLKSKFSSHPPVVSKHTVKAARKETSYDNRKSIELLDLNYNSIDKTLQDITQEYRRSQEQNRDYGMIKFQ